MTPRDIVAEKVFLSDIEAQVPDLAAIRREFYGSVTGAALHPAATLVQQPPAQPGQLCEVQALALRGAGGSELPSRHLERLPWGATGRVVEASGLRHLFLANLTGGSPGDGLDFPAQASSMLRRAEALLGHEGLSFKDVVRTWIYLADIERHYAALNGARRRFLTTRGVQPPPASTGIHGALRPRDRLCGLDLRAIAGHGALRVTPLHSPTMNEASSYGSDFSRGMRVDLEDHAVLYISGTASIDTEGRVVHPGDLEGQVDRMLLNIEALLAGQGARFLDAVSSVTYIREAGYAAPFRRVAARRGLHSGLPNTVCLADICRPEWLCEMEMTAVLT